MILTSQKSTDSSTGGEESEKDEVDDDAEDAVSPSPSPDSVGRGHKQTDADGKVERGKTQLCRLSE